MDEPLTPDELALVRKLLGDPMSFPLGFKQWVTSWAEANPPRTTVGSIVNGTSFMQQYVSATPPASPFNGQVWIYPITANIRWQFQYNAASASAYKWESIGTSTLSSGPTGDITVATTTPTAMTGGPAIVTPRPGIYLATFGAQECTASSTEELTALRMTGSVSGASGVQANTVVRPTNGWVTGVTQVCDFPSAVETWSLECWTAGAASTRFFGGYIRMTPLSVS